MKQAPGYSQDICPATVFRGAALNPKRFPTGKEKGKTVSVYVPRGWEAEARKWVENHRLLKKLIRDLSDIQKQILRLREK